jgi:5-(carboxyamino)imidazole ribonucleotide mutase
MPQQRVIVIMGSKKDLAFASSVGSMLKRLGLKFEYRVASAHKTPRELLKILEAYEALGESIVYISIAGMSNALSGFIDANTKFPVIACPPLEKLDLDVYSSLRMPSGVAPLVVLNPENAALAAAKILGLENPSIYEKISKFQLEKRKEVAKADDEVRENIPSNRSNLNKETEK